MINYILDSLLDKSKDKTLLKEKLLKYAVFKISEKHLWFFFSLYWTEVLAEDIIPLLSPPLLQPADTGAIKLDN